jgi:tetratricopeptide (TPR) repeat protein
MDATNELDDLVKQAQRCVRKGETQRAIELFLQALARDDQRLEIYEGLAAAHFQKGDFAEAAAHFVKISLLKPTDGKCLINLGAVYNRLAEHKKAVDALRKGIAKEKRCPQGFYNLGIAYRGLNQSSMAVSAYREAIRINPGMAEAHQNLANIYVEMGNHQQAILHYKKALEINPDFERAKRGMVQAENAALTARGAISPFGRLVDEKAYGAKTATQADRPLTEQERQEDRQRVQLLCLEIEAAASLWLQHLKGELEPALLALNRIVAQKSDPSLSMARALTAFRAANEKSSDLRRQLKRKLLELRAHEELINTPDLQPQG